MKNKLLMACLSLGLVFALSACANNPQKKESTADTTQAAQATDNTSNNGQVYKIGVLQLVQHPALDESNKGFFKAFEDENIPYVADQQNAGGEISTAQTIADKLVSDKNDLIFAIATPAAQAVAGLTSDIPIVITAVTDPKDSGLVDSNEAPGKNVTGTSDLTPVKEQIQLLKNLLPNAKKVGMLYSSAEANSVFQINIAHAACKEEGLEYEDFSVSSLNEIQTIVESMIGKVDAIYVPTDNMVASGMSTVSMIATNANIPIIGAEVAHVKNGALATYGINYFELGYLAGKQAIRILRDKENPANMPIEYLDKSKCEFSINDELAKKLNIDTSVIKK